MFSTAVIGCGKIGSEFSDDPQSTASGICTHAAAYAACPATKLVAVCDSDPERVERCGRRWGVAGCYRDAARLLAEARPAIVSVCTPDASHYELVRSALVAPSVQAVLAEKPLATTLSHAQQLAQLARQRGVLLAVNYSRRYAASHVQLRSFLLEGGIGEVRLVRGLYTKGTLHNGSHFFDLFRFLVSEVTRVEARDRLQEGGADPTLDVELHGEGGVVAQLAACSSSDFTIFEMELLGTRGRIRITESGNVIEHYEVVDGHPFAGYRGLVLKNRTTDGLRDVVLYAVEDVVACLQTSKPPRCSAEDGMRALQIALAARESAAVGKTSNLRDAT